MKFSASHRKRIGDVQRGKPKRPRSAQHAANLSNALKGHTVSEATRQKLREAALKQKRERNAEGQYK